jgi:hypothetical protein
MTKAVPEIRDGFAFMTMFAQAFICASMLVLLLSMDLCEL